MVLGPYDPGATAGVVDAATATDPSLAAPAASTPVALAPVAGEARCGRWYCADQLPQAGSAVAVGDVDGDGRPDLLLADTGRVLSTLGRLMLLHNDGDMRFSDATIGARLTGYGAWSAIFGDLDNDGDQDLVLGGRRDSESASEHGDVLIFFNGGRGRFAPPVTVPRTGDGVPLALELADLNGDGRLDIVAGFSGTSIRGAYAPRVFEGQLDGTFVERTAGLSDEGFTWIALATDLNGDAAPDLLFAHDGHALYQGTREEGGTVGCMAPEGPSTQAWLNAGYRNRGVAAELGMLVDPVGPGWSSGDNTPMSLVPGDFDDDGSMDLLTTQTGDPLLFRGSPDGSLQGRAEWPGAWRRSVRGNGDRGVGWGALGRDVDRDGDLDAVVAYGVIPTTVRGWPNSIYLNDGAAGLRLAPSDSGLDRDGSWSALAAADFDGDGDDDLVVGAQTLFRRPCDGAPQRAMILTNVSAWPGRHWLRVRLVGTVSNRDGLGARVEATVRGHTMRRGTSRAGSTMSSSTRDLDFGLGDSASVDDLTVRWPSGVTQTLHAVPGDQLVVVREPQWLGVDAQIRGRGQVITARLGAQSAGAAQGALSLELRGTGRWVEAPHVEAGSGDLVGRFTGDGTVWVRSRGPGRSAAIRTRFR
jgi:enediyne biosynthesis protein E4